jgi:hypothetical protein
MNVNDKLRSSIVKEPLDAVILADNISSQLAAGGDFSNFVLPLHGLGRMTGLRDRPFHFVGLGFPAFLGVDGKAPCGPPKKAGRNCEDYSSDNQEKRKGGDGVVKRRIPEGFFWTLLYGGLIGALVGLGGTSFLLWYDNSFRRRKRGTSR